MSDRWKLGNYQFTINPNKYAEQISVIGDTVVLLDGTVVSQPTTTKEDYSLSSIFYQNRPRVITSVSMPNLGGVKVVNGKYYILNNTTKKVDVYNSNFSLTKSITLVATPSGENFTSFDVQTDETVWAVQSSSPDIIYTVVGASITKKNFISSLGRVQGIKFNNGSLWVINDSCVLYNLDTNFNVIKNVTLPYISTNNLGYKGIEMINGYLAISFTSDDITGVYNIDISNGNICNAFSLPDYTKIIDVTYDGTNYIFATFTGNQLVYTNGNTLMLDLYLLEKEIKTKGYIDMIDDMGIKRRMSVSQYSIERLEGSLEKYNVDISATKVDRGVS